MVLSGVVEVSDKLARALQALRVSLGVRDVLTNGRDTIWVLGGPQTLRRTLGPGGGIRNWLELTGSRERAAGRGLHRVGGSREDPLTLEAYRDNANYWDGWENAVNFGLQSVGAGRSDGWAVIPVPAKTIPRKAWSSRRRAWLRAGPKPRFRLCEKKPVWFGNASGPVLFEVASDLPPLMLTHGVSTAGLREVRKCGGLLWPSWALSWRMPPSYGDVVFFGSSEVLVSTLKPTGTSMPSIYLAGTDIWSPTARELMLLEKAVEWELSGDRKWWDGDRSRERGGWGRRDVTSDILLEKLVGDSLVGSAWATFDSPEITEPLKTRRQLVRRFRKLFAQYTVDGDPYAFPERDDELRASDTPYPYGELKVTGLVELRDLPLVVYPRRLAKTVNRLLDEQGFRGVRLPVTYRGPLHTDANEAERRDYAALVTQAALEWSQAPCHAQGAQVGAALRTQDSWRSTYDATAWWITGGSRTYGWQPGFCGGKDPGARATRRLSPPLREWLAKKQKHPARWGLELTAVVAELHAHDLGDLADWYTRAEQGRFRLTAADAREANRLGWFRSPVERGTEVMAVNTATAL